MIFQDLTIKEGDEYHEGPEDLSGSLTIFSTGEALAVQIYLEDDQISEQDHVNLWFNLAGSNHRTLAFSDSTLVCLEDGGDTPQTNPFLQDELQDPLIACWNPQEEFRKSQLDSLKQIYSDYFLAHYVDEYLPTPKSIQHTSAFYGHTGFRFHFEWKSISLIRPEAYTLFEEAVGTKRGDWLSYLSYEQTQSGNGQLITVILPPEALGFMHREGYQKVYVLMEIIDVDDEGVTRLLTSSTSNVENPQTYPIYKVKPPITAEVYPTIPEYGAPSTDQVTRDIKTLAPDLFFYSEAGWVPLSFYVDRFDWYDQPSSCWFEHITKCGFRRDSIMYDDSYMGTHRIELFSESKSTVRIVNDTTSQINFPVMETFLFGDGSLAQLTVEEEVLDPRYPDDMVTRRLFLYRNGICHQELAEYHHSLADDELLVVLADSIRFKPYWNDVRRWESITTLDTDHMGLIVEFPGKGRYRISWNEAGAAIRADKLSD